jgi:hypothetical protein
LTERAFAVYVSRIRRKEMTQRTAAAAEAFFRAGNPGQILELEAPGPAEQVLECSATKQMKVDDPASRTMQKLRKRRFDIREAHQNGDPTKVKLI